MGWAERKRSTGWIIRHDLSGALAAIGVVVAVGAALVAAGLVDLKNPVAFWIGLALMGLGLVFVIMVFGFAVQGRIHEERYRHRLTTFASNGRQFWTRLLNSYGADFPDEEINAWEKEVRVLLDEMDPTGVYVQRFDIAAGLPTVDDRLFRGNLSAETKPGKAARSLSSKLVRLSEFMQESER